MGPLLYKLVLKDSFGAVVWTVDNTSAVASSGSAGSAWSINGSTIYNGIFGSKVCISPGSICTALAQLNVQGTSVGNNLLLRIDDTGGSPGMNLYANGVSVGSYTGDVAGGLRLRAGSGASQMTIAQGAVTIQDASTGGATALFLRGGQAQGSNFLSVQNNGGTLLSWIDSAGRFVSPLLNSTAAGASIAFQTSGSTFSVNGFGDLSANGQINVIGTNDSANGADNSALKVNGTQVIDNMGNAKFTSLTCTGTPCGSGGGGGGFPVVDSTVLFFNASDATKTAKFSFAGLTTGTQRTYNWPDADVGIVGDSNAQTLTGAKTFSALITASAGVAGTNFNGTNTSTAFTFQNANNNFLVNGNGDISAAGNTVISGYISGVGAVSTNTFLGMKCTSTTPGSTPNATYSGLVYKGGTTNCTTGGSGLHIWLYDTVHSAWSDIDLGAVAGGITSINGQTGAGQTIAGTTNEITATTTTNTVTLSTPQPIGTTSSVTFGNVTSGGSVQAGAVNGAISFQNSNITNGNSFQVNGFGDVSANGQLNVIGTNDASNGGGNSAYKVNGVTAIDNGRNGFFNNVTIAGSCLGAGCPGGGGVSSITGSANQVGVDGDFGGSAHTGAISLTLPQPLGTGSTPTFTGIINNGAFNANVSGAAISFQNANTTFQVDGNGNISSSASLNLSGLSSTLKVAGNVVVNSSGQFVGTGVNVSQGVQAIGYNVIGGFIGQNWTLVFPSPFTIQGVSGSFTQLIVKGGVIVSAAP